MDRIARLTARVPRLREHLLPFAIFAAIVLLTLLIALRTYRSLAAQAQSYFEQAAEQTTLTIEERLAGQIDMLNSVAALFYATDGVTRAEFRRYMDMVGIARRYPAIGNIGFVQQVGPASPSGLAHLEREPGPCGPGHFQLVAENATLDFIVVYVEPIGLDQPLYGANLALDPACLAAMERAGRTGEVTATEPLGAGGDNQSTNAVRLFAPVLKRLNGGDVTELEGYVFVTFSVPEMIDGLPQRAALTESGIELQIHDGFAADEVRQIYPRLNTHALEGTERRWETTQFVQLAGRIWNLRYSTLPSFHPYSATLPWAILAVGTLVGAGGYRAVLVRRRHRLERERQTTALEYQATHDALTHLVNRTVLSARLDALIREDPHRTLGLLLIDLDGFKEINDTLGHQSGDLLLRQMGPRLQSLLRPGDLLARLGGDEFALLLSPLTGPLEAGACAREALDAIHRPFALEAITVQVDASVGIAFFPDNGGDSSTLLRCADVAMYIAKKNKVGFALYDPDQDVHSPRQLSLISQVSEAIAHDQLVLHYQPKIRLSDRQVMGVEALIRWDHPSEGLILPADFCRHVEQTTLIRPLTRWVAQQVARQYRLWEAAGLAIDIAFNISTRNLIDSDLPDAIAEALKRQGVPPERIEVEITESALITDPDRALDTLSRLRALGIRLVIDDYGTGYSSLAYLKRLPVSSLKIDASFVRDMTRDENDAILVRSTISLAHNMGLHVVAEGVEGGDVLDALARADCDAVQGRFLCPPLPAEEATAWLAAHRDSAAGRTR